MACRRAPMMLVVPSAFRPGPRRISLSGARAPTSTRSPRGRLAWCASDPQWNPRPPPGASDPVPLPTHPLGLDPVPRHDQVDAFAGANLELPALAHHRLGLVGPD